jgi:hypothetical protein
VKKQLAVLSAALCISFLFFSCQASQQAVLSGNGSGRVRFDYHIPPPVLETFTEMDELFSLEAEKDSTTFFDLDKIRKDFDEKDEIVLERLESPNPRRLEGEFNFSNVERIFASEESLEESGVLRYSSNGSSHTLSIYLSKDNFHTLSTVIPELDSPFFELFGPEANQNVSREEFLEMMEYTFDEEIRPLIETSVIEASITVDGRLIDQAGGKAEGNTVTFQIPLIDVLLLHEPLRYSLSFR